MDLRSIIATNAVAVALLVILYYVASVKMLRRRTEDMVYKAMIFGVMLGAICEAVSFLIDGKVFFGALKLFYGHHFCAALIFHMSSRMRWMSSRHAPQAPPAWQ